MMKTPTPFHALNEVLHQLVTEQQMILGDNLLACYLQGSFGLGDADEHSDVDFLVVIDRNLSDDEVTQLGEMHNRIFDSSPPWSTHLEGTYFPKNILKQAEPDPTPLWYIDNGSRVLEQSTHDNDHVVRWVTREHGIPLYGDDPKRYIDPVPVDDLKREVHQTMITWGQEIVDERYTIKNQWAQAFAVLSYCRMLQTMHTGAIHSKVAGVHWAKLHIDPAWHPLIDHAWANRPNPSKKIHLPADPDRIQATLDFIQYALERTAGE